MEGEGAWGETVDENVLFCRFRIFHLSVTCVDKCGDAVLHSLDIDLFWGGIHIWYFCPGVTANRYKVPGCQTAARWRHRHQLCGALRLFHLLVRSERMAKSELFELTTVLSPTSAMSPKVVSRLSML